MKPKREADKRHTMIWVGTLLNALIEVGTHLQHNKQVRKVSVTREKFPKGTHPLIAAMEYRIDIYRRK